MHINKKKLEKSPVIKKLTNMQIVKKKLEDINIIKIDSKICTLRKTS